MQLPIPGAGSPAPEQRKEKSLSDCGTERQDDSAKHKKHKKQKHPGGKSPDGETPTKRTKHHHRADKSPKSKSPRVTEDPGSAPLRRHHKHHGASAGKSPKSKSPRSPEGPGSAPLRRHHKHHDAEETPKKKKHVSSEQLGKKKVKKHHPVPASEDPLKSTEPDAVKANVKLTPIPVYDSTDFGSPGTGTTFISKQGKKKKRALLISCAYKCAEETQLKLDLALTNLHNLLTEKNDNFGFDTSDIKILIDAEFGGPNSPPSDGYASKENITQAMKELIQGAQSGDSFFFAFSGIGSPANGQGAKPGILPSDHAENGPINEETMHDLLVKPLPEGVRMTMLLDTPFVGFGLDLPYEYQAGEWKKVPTSYHVPADVRLFSTRSAPDDHKRGKLMTAFCDTIVQTSFDMAAITWTDLIVKMEEIIEAPGASTSKIIAAASQFYDCHNTVNLTYAEPKQSTQLGPLPGSSLSSSLKVDNEQPVPLKKQADGLSIQQKLCILGFAVGGLAAGVVMGVLLVK